MESIVTGYRPTRNNFHYKNAAFNLVLNRSLVCLLQKLSFQRPINIRTGKSNDQVNDKPDYTLFTRGWAGIFIHRE